MQIRTTKAEEVSVFGKDPITAHSFPVHSCVLGIEKYSKDQNLFFAEATVTGTSTSDGSGNRRHTGDSRSRVTV